MYAEYQGRLHYQVVAETRIHEELGKISTYGICLAQSGEDWVLHDVSVNRDVAASLTDLFNCHQLSPIHLHDAVLDLLP